MEVYLLSGVSWVITEPCQTLKELRLAVANTVRIDTAKNTFQLLQDNVNVESILDFQTIKGPLTVVVSENKQIYKSNDDWQQYYDFDEDCRWCGGPPNCGCSEQDDGLFYCVCQQQGGPPICTCVPYKPDDSVSPDWGEQEDDKSFATIKNVTLKENLIEDEEPLDNFVVERRRRARGGRIRGRYTKFMRNMKRTAQASETSHDMELIFPASRKE
jgi:hypothetical protein